MISWLWIIPTIAFSFIAGAFYGWIMLEESMTKARRES